MTKHTNSGLLFQRTFGLMSPSVRSESRRRSPRDTVSTKRFVPGTGMSYTHCWPMKLPLVMHGA